MQEHDRGKALALVNEENYWRSGSLATCGLANCMFVELEVIDEVRTVYGYMKLVKVSVIGQEDEDNGTLSLAPTIRFVFRKLEGV